MSVLKPRDFRVSFSTAAKVLDKLSERWLHSNTGKRGEKCQIQNVAGLYTKSVERNKVDKPRSRGGGGGA